MFRDISYLQKLSQISDSFFRLKSVILFAIEISVHVLHSLLPGLPGHLTI